MHIEELDLSVRTYNCLIRAGLDTVEKIREISDKELRKVKNLNEKCYKEIKNAILNLCK